MVIASPGLAAASAIGAYKALRGYKGDDAGFLVLSLTAQGLTQQYVLSLFYRRVGETTHDTLTGGTRVLSLAAYDIQTSNSKLHGLANFLKLNSDDDQSEQGDVLITTLAPGQYEIFNFSNFYSNGYAERTSTLPADISIPFEIKPGRATYIGNFKALAVYGRNIFGIYIPAGARYVVVNQCDRDIAIAKRKNTAITDVDIAIPDVDALNNPAFSTKP